MEPEGTLPHSQVTDACPILSQLDPAHKPTSDFLKIHFIIILLSTPGTHTWSLSLRFPHQNPVYASPLPIHATCPAHLIFLDFITRTRLGEEYRSLSSSIHNFLHSSVTSSLLDLGRTKVSFQVRGFLCEHFVKRYVFTVRNC